MASDLTSIIKDDICSTLESLLATKVSITTVSQATKSDLDSKECIRVDINFDFTVFGPTVWKFYIPTATATKFEFLMLGGISDEKENIDDEISDAVNEIVSNISGSMVTNINAQGFDDLGTTKFTNKGKEVVNCDSNESYANTYSFNLMLGEQSVVLLIEFGSLFLPYISEIATGQKSASSGSAVSSATAPAEVSQMNPILSLLGEESIANLKLLFDIKFKLSVRLGTKILLLKDVLTWDTGTIIELDQMVNEPLDILVNGVKIGEGEAVIVEGRFGIKIKHIGGKKLT